MLKTAPENASRAGTNTALQAWGPVGEYMTDAMQRTVLFWDVMRQRSDQYYAQKAKAVPHVLSFDAELVLDARTFDKPVNYLLVRVKPPAGRDGRSAQAAVRRGRSARRARAGHRRLQGRQRTGRGHACRPSVLLRRLHARADAGPDHRRHHARRGGVPGEGHRAAPRRRRQALRHRQLPGRLGGDDGGRDPARTVRADHRSRLAAVVLGRRAKARTRCATPAAWPAAAG